MILKVRKGHDLRPLLPDPSRGLVHVIVKQKLVSKMVLNSLHETDFIFMNPHRIN